MFGTGVKTRNQTHLENSTVTYVLNKNCNKMFTFCITVTSHERHGASNHRPLDCLFNNFKSPKNTSKPALLVFEGNAPRASGFPHNGPVTQKASPYHDVIFGCPDRLDDKVDSSSNPVHLKSNCVYIYRRHCSPTPVKVFCISRLWKPGVLQPYLSYFDMNWAYHYRPKRVKIPQVMNLKTFHKVKTSEFLFNTYWIPFYSISEIIT